MKVTVAEALAQVFDLVDPTEPQIIDIADAGFRMLATDITAQRDQPPFAASAMDGYAIKAVEAEPEVQLQVIGQVAAGGHFEGQVKPGQAVRIFTGAPVPAGADKILIQEDCTRQGDLITIHRDLDQASYIRPAGGDFRKGDKIKAPQLLDGPHLALAAAMGSGRIEAYRKPVFALIATGDELVYPGQTPGPDQIISSNNFGLKAMIEAAGGIARILPIARDTPEALNTVLDLAQGADCIVTLGGASVGDHDLMGKMAQSGALDTAFYTVLMRPGKPLMAGRYKGTALIGLPGNPVSALVCGHVFLRPMLAKMLGQKPGPLARVKYPLAQPIGPNGPREHYMRAQLVGQKVTVFSRQDSSLLSIMARANALVVRPPNDPARPTGALVETILL